MEKFRDFYLRFGKILIRSRKKAGLSQSDMAMAINLSRSSVANIEHGRQKVSLHTFVRMLSALEARPEELLPIRAAASPDLSSLEEDEREFVKRGLGLS